MLPDSFTAHRLAKEHVRDILHWAERDRLARVVREQAQHVSTSSEAEMRKDQPVVPAKPTAQLLRNVKETKHVWELVKAKRVGQWISQKWSAEPLQKWQRLSD